MYAVASPNPRNASLPQRLSKRLGVPFHLIENEEGLDPMRLENLGVRKIFFPHWSSIIDPDVHEKFECIIFHMTDLPYGRGGSPLQNLIVRGHKETRISAIRCVAEVDAGPVYTKHSLSLQGTAEQILRRADKVIESMIAQIIEESLEPKAQDGEVTTFRRRLPQDGNIAGVHDTSVIYDKIRMLDADGYPPAFIETGNLRMEFTGATLRRGSVEADVRITVIEPNEETLS
jgi:methionyl-tRNA formyltransferase